MSYKESDLCPNCGEFVDFYHPDDCWEEEEEGAIYGGVICPHCGEQLVVFYIPLNYS